MTGAEEIKGDKATIILHSLIASQTEQGSSRLLWCPAQVMPVCWFSSDAGSAVDITILLRVVQGRPGAGLPPVNLRQLENDLKEKHGKNSISYRDVMSSAMYPKVFDDFK